MTLTRASIRAPGRPLSWLGALLAVYLLGPLVVFGTRFATPGDHGYSQPGLWNAFETSAISASLATAIILVTGVPLAHWLAVSESKLARAVGVLVRLPLALPPVMSGIVLIYVVGPYTPIGELFGGDLTDSLVGVVIAQTFVAAPFLVIGARSAFRGIDPALDEVAGGLGLGPSARFFRVAVPAASEGIRAALVLTWLRALGEYGATALLAYHPYTLPVFVNVQFQGAGLPTTQAPTALALGVAIIAIAVGAWPRRGRRRPVRLPVERMPSGGSRPAVHFDLAVRRGAFGLTVSTNKPSQRIAVLGPSGAGKTLTLRAISGLVHGERDSVVVGGRELSDVPFEQRGIGFVAQGGVLLPRRTVWHQANLGVSTDPAVAAWWLRILRIEELAERLPTELSGGQRQRVALAQVLSREPSVVLLDEPFAALDGPIRDELRTEFRRLQHERGLSTIVVTHDPEEAAYLADDVIVLDEGRVLQQGPLAEVYRNPASARVARLVGVRNVNEGFVDHDGSLRVGDDRILHSSPIAPRADGRTHVLWAARPEAVIITPNGSLRVVVRDVIDLGGASLVELSLSSGATLVSRDRHASGLTVGDRTTIDIDPAGVSVWPGAE